MSNVRITTEVLPTWRDVQGRFARAEKELLEARRDELRGEGRVIVQMARANLREKIGRPSGLENAIRFNTQDNGDTIVLNVTAPGYAKPHKIQARYKSALSFFWPRVGLQVAVPKRGGFRTHVSGGTLWVGKGYVNHPGGSLVPLMTPVLQKTNREWLPSRGDQALRRMSLRYVQELTR